MKITKLSENFTPLQQGIFFDIDTELGEPTNLLVEIIDVVADSVVATQQLREVTSARVNIAPYLSFAEEHKPTIEEQSTFVVAPSACYKIRINNTLSESVVVSVNRGDAPKLPAVITSRPSSRRIAYGERDEVLVLSEPGCFHYARLTADTGEIVYLESPADLGATTLAISTEDFDSEIKHLDVALYCDGDEIVILNYKVEPRHNKATRLAWISECGSIERYPFPAPYKVQRSVEKGGSVTSNGFVATPCRTTQTLSLCSRYEPRAEIENLSQIVSSPRVWIEESGDLRSVEVTTSAINHNLFGEPDSIELNICSWEKEVNL